GLLVGNPGNSVLTVQLSATDPEGVCTYTFDPNPVELSAGENRDVRLSVQAKAPLPGRHARICPFIVTARLAGSPGASEQVQGVWEQVPPNSGRTPPDGGQENGDRNGPSPRSRHRSFWGCLVLVIL